MEILKEALLYIHDNCNYKCSYCMLGSGAWENKKYSKAHTEEGIKAIVDFFNKEGQWHILLSGGEPTLHPQFIKLCKELTKENYIRLDTNNSMEGDKLLEFINKIDAKRVDFINCSLHEVDEEEERLNKYLERVKLLIEKGFKAYVSYVAVPNKFHLIPKFYEMFKENNVPFVVMPFRSPEYPQNYTKEELDILDKYMISATNRALVTTVDRKPKGKLCSAGYKRIKINGINGDIRKCWHGNSILGNIYDGTIELSEEPSNCDCESCTYMFEPHLEVQELLYKDLENIFSLKGTYDKELCKEYMQKSL